MAQGFSPPQYCPSCAAENPLQRRFCRVCGTNLIEYPSSRARRLATILRELAALVREGVIEPETYYSLEERFQAKLQELTSQASPRAAVSPPPTAEPTEQAHSREEVSARRYRRRGSGRLGAVTPAPAPRPATPPTATAAARTAAAVASGAPPHFVEGGLVRAAAAWLPEQQANLLLYLGAFLIVVATLTLVGSSQRSIGPAGNMALLVGGSGTFLSAGLVCLRGARVRQAGTVFIAVAALMFPLNFVGAYVFFLDEREVDPAGLWLGGSLASALFYGAVSFLGLGRWYPVPSATGLVSALLAALVLLDAPSEIGPASFILLGLLLAAPSLRPQGRVRDVIGQTWSWIGHIVVASALVYGLLLTAASDEPDVAVDVSWLWLGASLASLAFFATVAWWRPGAWHRWPAVVSLAVLLASCLGLAEAPREAYVVAYSLFAVALATPCVVQTGKAGVIFGLPAVAVAYAVATGSLVAALVLSGEDVSARWYLPASLAALSAFLWLQTLAASDEILDGIGFGDAVAALFESTEAPNLHPMQGLAALLLSGAAALSVVYAFGLGGEWYGPAMMVVAWLYVAGAAPVAPRWPGQPFLGWLALTAASLSWTALAFSGSEAQVAGDALAAVLLYLAMARLFQADERVIALKPVLRAFELPVRGRLAGFVVAALTYASGVALSVGFFDLLDATSLIETQDAVDVAYAFFGLSLGLTAVAATTRWWWPEVRPHFYAVALIMGQAVFLAAVDSPGKAPVVLTVYAAVALAAALWERQPFALVVSAAFAFFAVLSGWRYLEPRDGYAPLVLTAAGIVMTAAPLLAKGRLQSWTGVLRATGVAYLALAPAAGLVRLVVADSRANIDSFPTDPTLLPQVGFVATACIVAGFLKVTARLRWSDLMIVGAAALAGAYIVSQVGLAGAYADFPDHAAAVHLGVLAFFTTAARLLESRPDVRLFPFAEFPWTPEITRRVSIAALVYAAGLSLSSAFFYLLSASAAVDTGSVAAVAWAFFGLSLGIAVGAATSRWWWPQIRPHLYAVALVMSVAVVVAVVDRNGQAAAMLTAYTGLALAAALWEREPIGLIASAGFGFFAFLAGWRYLEPDDAYAPLVATAVGVCTVLALPYLRGRLGRYRDVLLPVGAAYLGLAPAVSLVRLAVVVEPDAGGDGWPSDPTLLLQIVAAGALVACAGLATATRLLRTGEVMIAGAGLAAFAGLSAWANLSEHYLRHPDYAAAVNLAALAFFLTAGRLVASRPDIVLYGSPEELGPPSQEALDARRWTVVALIYAAGWALNLTFYYLLDAVSVLDAGADGAVSWAFFGLSCFEAGIAVTARWAWPDVRRHVFAVAVASSVFSLATAADLEGQVTLLLTLYAALAVVLSVREREHLGFALAAAYAFVAVFAARRYLGADEALVPLALSAMGYVVFAASVALGKTKTWSPTTLAIASVYAASAPIVAWLRLTALADDGGYIGDEHVLETGLYQAGVLSLAVLGGLAALKALLERSLVIAAGSSLVLMGALLLEIAHFQPDNVQAYTVPIGLYFVAATLLASRYGQLPEELSPVLERLYALGPTIVMAPSFVQSLNTGGWEYGLALLLESLAFLALAVIQRRVWLLTVAVSFVVLNALHYLFFEEGLPTWATLSLAGTLLMGAGTAILVGRDRWPEIQSAILAWWERKPQPA